MHEEMHGTFLVLFSIVSNGFKGVLCASSGEFEQAQILLKLFTLLYADDTILITDSAEDLQNGLNIFHLYCNQWKLKINTSKTKIVILAKVGPQQALFSIMIIRKSK